MNTNSPVRALCAALAIIALSLAVLLSDSGPGGAGPGKTFAVTIRHYGVDAREMERVCAIPLEDALSALPGLARIASTSEDGMVRVFLRFDGARPGQYEALREAVQGVYETLPSSCQRPVIATEDEARSPIWSAAVRLRDGSAGLSRLGLILEKTVKPALESLPGAGEVEIAGPGVPEVVVELDRGAAPLLGLRPDTVGAYLAERDLVLPGGSIIQGGREIYLPVEGRYDSAEDLREALVTAGEQYAGPLKSLARVYERERPADSLSRLDGQPAAYIAVIGAGSGTTSARRLSQAIKAATLQFADLDFEVLSDRGAEEEKSYRQVLKGMLQGAAAVALAIVFLQGKGRKNLLSLAISAAEAPVMLFVAAALLKALGTPLDKAALAGLAAGVGSAVDAVILGAPRSGVPRNEALREMKAVLPSLVSGAATTLAALMPLAFIDGGETRAIVLAIGSITFTALVFATVVMPPLLLWGKDRESGVGNRESKKILTSRQRSCRRLPTPVFSATELPPTPDTIDSRHPSFRQRSCRRLPIPSTPDSCLLGNEVAADSRSYFSPLPFLRRFPLSLVRFSAAHPLAVAAFWAALTAAGAGAFVAAGADTSPEGSHDSLFLRAEFAPGVLMEKVDEALVPWTGALRAQAGVRHVQVRSQIGGASIEAAFDPEVLDRKALREAVRGIPLEGGFVYIPEGGAGERVWELKVSGEDDRVCRELAGELASASAAIPIVEEAVLNFKEGSMRLVLRPLRERMPGGGIDFSVVAGTLRGLVHGPVAYKRSDPAGGETDLRVRGFSEAFPSREDFEAIAFAGPDGGVYALKDLVSIEEKADSARIYRDGRIRCASFSLRTKNMDSRKAKKAIMSVLGERRLPRGYTLEFDRDAIEDAEALSGTALLFAAALLLCFMVIGAVHESFTFPLGVLAAIPPSMALPALLLAGGGVQRADACAFIAVSGMAVNAAVLAAGAMRRGGLPAIGEALPHLWATTLTTVLGASPFIFFPPDTYRLVHSLAVAGALGVGASFLCALSLIPALGALFPGMFGKGRETINDER